MTQESKLYEILGVDRTEDWVGEAVEEADENYAKASNGLTYMVSDLQDLFPHLAGNQAFAFIAGPFVTAVLKNAFTAGYMLGLQSGERRQIRDAKLRLMLERGGLTSGEV